MICPTRECRRAVKCDRVRRRGMSTMGDKGSFSLLNILLSIVKNLSIKRHRCTRVCAHQA